MLADGVAADPNALGYFGYAYYQENRARLKLVAIDHGKGCVQPTPQTVADATYQPLSRPMFVYVRKASAASAATTAFMRSYLTPDSAKQVASLGYVPLPPAALLASARRFDKGMAGSQFGGRGSVLGLTPESFQDEERVQNALVR